MLLLMALPTPPLRSPLAAEGSTASRGWAPDGVLAQAAVRVVHPNARA